MTTPIDAWPTWRSRVVGASQGGYRPLLVGHPAGQLGGSKRAHGWWRRRTPIKMDVANGLGGARPPDRLRPLPTMRRGGDRLRMSVDRAADVHGGPVSVGRGTRWVSHRYWSKISLAFACAFAKIWDAEAKTAAASLCLNPGWFGKALKRKSPTRQRWRALMASARGAVSAPLQLAAAWWLRTRVRPSVLSCAHRRKAPLRTRLVGQCSQHHQ